MKLLITWLITVASFTVFVDSISIQSDDYGYLGDDEEVERAMPLHEKEFGINDLLKAEMDSKYPNNCTNLSVAICKPFTKGKILGVLKQLGMTKDPAIQIAKVSESFRMKLKKNNGVINATPRRKRTSSNNKMCGESTVIKSFQLIHPDVSLMYVVNEVTCTNNFFFSSYCAPNIPIGECVVKMGKVRLTLFNRNGELYTKTVEAGMACKCKPFR